MTSALTERHSDVLSPMHRLFPRMTGQDPQPIPEAGTTPWGARFAEPITAHTTDPVPDVTYDPQLQIGVTIGGDAACDIAPLVAKKGNTVEDSQTFPDEYAQ